MNPVEILDYAGVALFAGTGALAASRKQLDIIGFLFLGAVTGMGGGTMRDLILAVPVFWMEQPLHVLVCAIIAVVVYFSAPAIESRYRLLLWLDAIALSAYCVFGAYKGLQVTGSATIGVVMGMMTGTLGGIVRDVITGEPSVVLRKDIYVAATMAGAALFLLLERADLPLWLASTGGFAIALLLRGGTIRSGWRLPAYKSRPGRDPDSLR